MLRKLKSFFKEYRALSLVIIAIIVGLAVDLAGYDRTAQILLSTVALVATVPLLADMWHTLRTGEYGIDILAVTAIVTAVILGEYWAAIVIVLMITGGGALEEYAQRRAKTELNALISNKPRKAHVIKGKRMVDVNVHEVKAGDKLAILPGEVVPVDSEIIEGNSSFDESSLTGESLPTDKTVGDTILSGSINAEGAITARAIRKAADSQYEQIIKLVRSAASSQSPFVRLADRYSIPFTATAYVIAGSAWLVSGDPLRFLQVLVVATPCPLILGAPIALVSGMSRAAKDGIIVKNGTALEKLAEVETIAFDKTGTLTLGQPAVKTIKTYNNYSKTDVISYAAALEQRSNHVLARAIVNEATNRSLRIQNAKQVKELAGHGLSGRLSGKDVLVGRLRLLEERDTAMPKNFRAAKETASYVAIDGKLAGVITYADEIRMETAGMLERLQAAGIKNSMMVTGDNKETAAAIARQLGIEHVEAECLPADKMFAIERAEPKPVAFVGDGVNDAPVLTAADVGIALGARGSTAASESADVVIMLDDVGKVASGVEIAQRTFRIARQSILIGIFISIGLMGVFWTGRFSALTGAFAQEVVDIIVIVYALRAHHG